MTDPLVARLIQRETATAREQATRLADRIAAAAARLGAEFRDGLVDHGETVRLVADAVDLVRAVTTLQVMSETADLFTTEETDR